MLEFKITIHGRASSPDMADVDLIAALATVTANAKVQVEQLGRLNPVDEALVALVLSTASAVEDPDTLLVTEDVWARVETRQSV